MDKAWAPAAASSGGGWQNLLDWCEDTQPHSKLSPEPTEKGIPQASEPDFTPSVSKLF